MKDDLERGKRLSEELQDDQSKTRQQPRASMDAPSIGDNIGAGHAAWSFFGLEGACFSEHIRKSVPFYDEGHDLVCRISDFFVTSPSPSVCYELGTSTANLLIKLAKHNQHKKNVRWVGIDLAPELIAEGLKKTGELKNVELVVDDIVTYEYEPTDFIVACLTVQFVPPRIRQELINKIYNALNWGGGFVLFEKVRAPDARFQDMMTSLYNDFKLGQGYTSEEIINKAQSLRGILEPFSTEGNLGLLRRAGFEDIMTIMKYVCFECYLAIK